MVSKKLIDAINDSSNVKGYTHDFYNYPARFSPLFVRQAIEAFTTPGDLIIDPFMGGGTTLIEASLLERNSIGLDISSLAAFIAKTKTTPISPTEITKIHKWFSSILKDIDFKKPVKSESPWNTTGYYKNITGRSTWRITRLIEQLIFTIEECSLSKKQQNLIRCCILKTGQWALDNKKETPSVKAFKKKLSENLSTMLSGASEYYERIKSFTNITTTCLNKSSQQIDKLKLIREVPAPKLILTSPPYPGVHVLYHRWQVHGRKETPAPFWIANSLDGHGLAHYTMGSRHQKNLNDYFLNIKKTFSALKNICNKETLVIQMLAFSEIDWQLPKYLATMEEAGFKETHFTQERLWRDVPNRKWYADNKGKTDSSNEVVLFHKLNN